MRCISNEFLLVSSANPPYKATNVHTAHGSLPPSSGDTLLEGGIRYGVHAFIHLRTCAANILITATPQPWGPRGERTPPYYACPVSPISEGS